MNEAKANERCKARDRMELLLLLLARVGAGPPRGQRRRSTDITTDGEQHSLVAVVHDEQTGVSCIYQRQAERCSQRIRKLYVLPSVQTAI